MTDPKLIRYISNLKIRFWYFKIANSSPLFSSVHFFFSTKWVHYFRSVKLDLNNFRYVFQEDSLDFFIKEAIEYQKIKLHSCKNVSFILLSQKFCFYCGD